MGLRPRQYPVRLSLRRRFMDNRPRMVIRMVGRSQAFTIAPVQNHNRFMDAYRASVPWVAGRAASTGANLDLAVVRIGAKYGAQIPTK
jgi:hypothetical protein